LLIAHEPGGTTLLSGYLPDQAALYGVLLTIRRPGLCLLSLEMTRRKRSLRERSLKTRQ